MWGRWDGRVQLTQCKERTQCCAAKCVNMAREEFLLILPSPSTTDPLKKACWTICKECTSWCYSESIAKLDQWMKWTQWQFLVGILDMYKVLESKGHSVYIQQVT